MVKPVAMLADELLDLAQPGDTVLDPLSAPARR
jgi:hypothetical protein